MQVLLQKNNHYPSLDGLRGFATILVILHHYFSSLSLFNFGWIGIELFFVLSGFLISARLIPFLNEKKLVVNFYWNRFLRIVPLYFLFLTIFFGSWFLFTSSQSQQDGMFYKKHYWQFFLFIQNWAYIIDFSQSNNHLQHLWSLAVEEQIYLIYPILVVAFFRKTNFLYVVLSLIIIIVITRLCFYYFTKDFLDFKYIYWNTFFRADSFFCGVAAYLAFTNYKQLRLTPTLFGIAIILLCVGLGITQTFDKSHPFFSTVGRTLLAISFSYLMLKCIEERKNHFSRFFSTRFLIFTGKISYGIFIFHWPILITGFAIINKILAATGTQISQLNILLINIFCSAAITVLLSYASYRYFESRFVRWKIRMR